MIQYWGGGGTSHFFLLILYNFKILGGEGWHVAPGPPTPRSLVFFLIKLPHAHSLCPAAQSTARIAPEITISIYNANVAICLVLVYSMSEIVSMLFKFKVKFI